MVDLTGKRFGRLTVIRKTNQRTNHGSIIWLCHCDCGNDDCYVSSGNLRSGNTNSCGCYNKQRIKETQTKQNRFDLSGDYGVGYTEKGEEFYFDLEDYDKIKNNCWCITNEGYFISTERGNRTKFVYLSRTIMNVTDNTYDVDHINHNLADNRKSNLRIVTRTQNNMNRSLQSNNTSGVTGVCFDKKADKWCARITVNKQTFYLGWFTNFEDAVKARRDGELKYFGEYRYKNNENDNGGLINDCTK